MRLSKAENEWQKVENVHKKIHKRKRCSVMVFRARFDSRTPIYIQCEKWSFPCARAPARSLTHSFTHLFCLLHTHKHTYIRPPDPKSNRNWDEYSGKKNPIGKLVYEANSVRVMYRMILLPIHIHNALALNRSHHTFETHTAHRECSTLLYLSLSMVCVLRVWVERVCAI